MQPEYRIAWADALLESTPGIEPVDLTRPCMPGLDPRNTGLADTKLFGDRRLRHPFGNPNQDCSVAGVQRLHARALATDDFQRAIRLDGLDRDVGPDEQQEAFYIGGAGYGEAVEPLALCAGRTPVFLNAPKAEPRPHSFKAGSDRVRQAQSDAALVSVDLNAPLAIKETGEVARKGVSGKVGHIHALDMVMQTKPFKMAVPCMAWIGRRIAAQEADIQAQAGIAA